MKKSKYQIEFDNRLSKLEKGGIGYIEVRWQDKVFAEKYIEKSGVTDITYEIANESCYSYQKWFKSNYCKLYFKK